MAKNEPKEVRVNEIIQAAIEEFIEKGYDGASMDQIAKRAGVSKGGVYYHFPNKEVLLMMANEKISEPVIAMMEKAMKNTSPSEGLREYIKEYIFYWGARPVELSFIFLSMVKALQQPVLMEYYKEYTTQATEFYVGMFAMAVEAKELEIEDVEAYGISLMGALDGLVTYTIICPEYDIEAQAERFSKI